MLAQSSHAWKVNFCKFTNETRNGMEDSSRHDGLKFLAALNGTTAGGGYELALACDEIVLIDDRSSAVSLPEVPLLGVLPGTGGLTRVVAKAHLRRSLLRPPKSTRWAIAGGHCKWPENSMTPFCCSASMNPSAVCCCSRHLAIRRPCWIVVPLSRICPEIGLFAKPLACCGAPLLAW